MRRSPRDIEGNLLRVAESRAKRLLASREADSGTERTARLLLELVKYARDRDKALAERVRQVGLLRAHLESLQNESHKARASGKRSRTASGCRA